MRIVSYTSIFVIIITVLFLPEKFDFLLLIAGIIAIIGGVSIILRNKE